MRLLIAAITLCLCTPGAIRGQVACPTPWQLDEVLRIGSLESTDLVRGVLDLAIGPDSALYVAQVMVPAGYRLLSRWPGASSVRPRGPGAGVISSWRPSAWGGSETLSG